MNPQPAGDVPSETDRISRVILDYATRIAAEQDPEMLLYLHTGLARDLANADRCSIWLADQERGELWTKISHGIDQLRIPLGQGLVGACVETNEVIVVNDTSADPRFLGQVDKKSGYVTDSVAVLPLRGAQGKVIGALQALNKPGGFTQRDTELLGLAAAYAARALETLRLRAQAEAARVLFRELEIARDVQQRLLPLTPPPIDGFEYAAFCRAAKFVGGDYYDVIELPNGLLAFTLGDVSGKGVAAAVLMASLQSMLRAHIHRSPKSLANMMNEFNKAVCRSSSPDRYSTLFCGLLDPGAKRLTYVNGGHVPPLLRRSNGVLERLKEGGMPVGLLEFARYTEGTIDLGSGDLLVCVSDGITEAVNTAGEIWDESGVEKVLKQTAGRPAAEFIECMVGAADAYATGAEQADDMTLVALRVL